MNNLITRVLPCFLCSLTANMNLLYTKLIKRNYKGFTGKVFKLLLCTGYTGVLDNEYIAPYILYTGTITNILLHTFCTRAL
jgi:hypothetical protein